jgi:hypothetical protein
MASEAIAKIKVESDSSQAQGDLKQLSDEGKKTSDDISKGFAIAGAAVAAFAVAGVAALKMVGASAIEFQTTQAMLESAVIDVSGGTLEQVDALNALSAELQKNGVLSDDAIRRGQAQLSTFGLSTETVMDLSGSLADLAVNQFGVNATGEQLEQSANMLQKALQGQFGVLEKSGIRFSDAQKEMILFGEESEKAAAIQEGFAQNLKFTNETALQTFEGQMSNVRNRIGDFSETIGVALLPMLTNMNETLGTVVDWFNGLSPATTTIIAKVLLFSTGLALVVAPMLLIIAALPTMITGFTALSAAAGIAWAAITGPIGIVVAAIALVVAAGVLLFQNWETIKAKAEEIFPGITLTITTIFESLKSTVDLFIAGLTATFQTFWEAVTAIWELALGVINFLLTGETENLKLLWTNAMTAIQTFLDTAWGVIKSLWSSGLTFLDTLTKSIFNGVSAFIGAAMDTVRTMVWNGLTGLLDLVIESQQPLIDAFATMWDGINGVISSAVDFLVEGVKSSLNFIIALINKVIGGLNSVAAGASSLPGVDLGQISTIPALAEGGIVTKPTLALVGEDGSEAVIPLSKMGNMGSSIIINITGPVSSKEVALEMLGEALQELKFSDKVV